MAENKKSILEEAQEIVHGARQANYGPPIVDFSRTAKMLTGLLSKKLKDGVKIEPEEVALIQVCVKLSRLIQTPAHRDSMVDIAGYIATYEMVMDCKAESGVPTVYEEKEIVELSEYVAAEKLEPERQYQKPAPTVYNNVLLVDQEEAEQRLVAEEIQKRLERERYHQNLRAMSVNPEAVHDDLV